MTIMMLLIEMHKKIPFRYTVLVKNILVLGSYSKMMKTILLLDTGPICD